VLFGSTGFIIPADTIQREAEAMRNCRHLQVGLSIIFAITGHSRAQEEWSLQHVATIPGFNVPECALYSPDDGRVYISNVESAPDEYWADDGKGYISILGADHRIESERWVNSEPECRLNAPKGMALLGDYLYFTDNTRLMRCTLAGDDVEILLSGLRQANDICTEGRSIWVSDHDRVLIFSPGGKTREIAAPEGINGLTFFKGKLYGVSWTLHDVYELDPSGKNDPVPFGLANHFTNLDGIEVLEDGTFIVSDFVGNKVCFISPDRSRVSTFIEITSPADIGLNRGDSLLYVPQFMEDKVSVFQIKAARK
jgi:DNA-binding beta-propeller fold protein YncE